MPRPHARKQPPNRFVLRFHASNGARRGHALHEQHQCDGPREVLPEMLTFFLGLYVRAFVIFGSCDASSMPIGMTAPSKSEPSPT